MLDQQILTEEFQKQISKLKGEVEQQKKVSD
jgi:hypothetical protein